MNNAQPKIGIVSGSGALPQTLAQYCSENGRSYFVIGIEGHTDPIWIGNHPHQWHRLGELGAIIETLKIENVQELVMIGGIKRPSIFDLKPDMYTAKLIARLGLRGIGDDGLLTFLIKELESQGFRVRGIQDIMNKDSVLLPSGPLGKNTPSEKVWADIRHGYQIGRLLGLSDVGQSVLVVEGLVLGVEAIEGTDALIKRCIILKKERLPNARVSGVLVKLCKPDQEHRADLPTLGVRTLVLLKEGGFAGIAALADKTLLVEPDKMRAFADQEGMFVLGLTEDAGALEK